MAVQRASERRGRGAGGGAASHDDEVDSAEFRLSQSKILANQTFHAVPGTGPAQRFAGDREAEPGFVEVVGAGEYRQVGVGGAYRLSKYTSEFVGAQQAPRPRKAVRAVRQTLYGELLASLGPARVQHGASARRLHPGAESVRPDPLDLAWLVCALHRRNLWFGNCRSGKKALNNRGRRGFLSMLWGFGESGIVTNPSSCSCPLPGHRTSPAITNEAR